MTSFDPSSFLDAEDTSPAPSSRKWSPFQQAIFDAIHVPTSNLIIQAVAGSGKTTTLIEALRHAPGSALFMAFNKSIALDIAARAPKGDVKTLNAMGHRLWRENLPQAKLDFNKVRNILKSFMSKDDYGEFGYQVERMVGLGKNLAIDLERSWDETALPEEFFEIADASDALPVGKENDAAIFAARAFSQSRNDLSIFDFDDQLYIPLYKEWQYPHYDNVFIDECQDLSPVQHLMLSEFASAGARVVAVGDRHQAIYGFRGADVRSMDNLKSRFAMLELPLSISYRCSQNVVKEAQQYCPTIAWRANAPEGTVKFHSDDGFFEDPHLFTRELVVCRNNAPLFRAILRHVREKSPCRVLSNFLESLSGFIRGLKVSRSIDLIDKINAWEEREVEKARKKGLGGKAAQVQDKAETIRLLAKETSTVSDIIALLKRLGERSSGPTFATIHKSKGLEADDVYLLRPDLVPSQWAQSPEAKQQEKNLAYVAITRAKEKLTYGIML